MPVLKVPVVHKFGIISHSQRLQLQSRLIKDVNSSRPENDTNNSKRNPFEITDEFVEKFNSLSQTNIETNSHELNKMNDIISKCFQKIKRRIGLQHNCEDEAHINVALGWTELTILSQCNGQLSNQCLDLLFLSLSVAPIQSLTFPVELYLLETALYFLQTSKFDSKWPEKHIKWLQISEAVALRIYVQCKLAMTQCKQENLLNLKIYLKEFTKCQKNFEKYPETAIPFCVIDEVSKYLLNSLKETGVENEHEIGTHDTSSLLWHCCDLWQCSFYSSYRSHIQKSINSIQYCLVNNPCFGNWIDCYLSFRVLANIACFEKSGLDLFSSIILGLSEANSELVLLNTKNEIQNDPDIEMKQMITEERICGYEKGTLLLFSAIREFCTLPLLSKTSKAKEQSLSVIAEWVLHGQQNESHPFSSPEIGIIVSRLQAILELLETTLVDSTISVIKNAIWSLLQSVRRKHILKNELDIYLRYGKIISPTLFSRDLSSHPLFINERISVALLRHIFPPVESSLPDPLNKDMQQINRSALKINAINLKYNNCEILQTEKKSKDQSNKKSVYIRQSDSKLNKMLQNFWNKELPDIEKSIEERIMTTQ